MSGCAVPPGPCQNPYVIPPVSEDLAWDQVVDVVDDYFTVDTETRVKRVGQVLTEGRLDTFPEIGSTLFEPWRHDSADGYEKVESTLQSIRRRAQVRVIPDEVGYLVDVTVYKELEDVPRPEHASSGAAAFRNDSAPQGFDEPVGGQQYTLGWIPQGRDTVLEQRILADIRARFAPPPRRGIFGRAPYAPAPLVR